MAAGAFRIWPTNKVGESIGDPAKDSPNPFDPNAVDFYIGVVAPTPPPSPAPGSPAGPAPAPAAPPPKDQMDLVSDIETVSRALRILYKPEDTRFRMYYVRLFSLGQLGLEGANAYTDVAKGALATVTAELIDDEAGRVKNDHLKKLGAYAAGFIAAFGALYWLMSCLPPKALLACLRIDPEVMANFMLLWMGAMLGVWLSYAIRTTTFTLRDLLITDNDRLVPFIRLTYAGSLSMILGLLLVTGIANVSVGGISFRDIATRPTLAFLVGVFCGIAELTLPTAVAKRASDFLSSVK